MRWVGRMAIVTVCALLASGCIQLSSDDESEDSSADEAAQQRKEEAAAPTGHAAFDAAFDRAEAAADLAFTAEYASLETYGEARVEVVRRPPVWRRIEPNIYPPAFLFDGEHLWRCGPNLSDDCEEAEASLSFVPETTLPFTPLEHLRTDKLVGIAFADSEARDFEVEQTTRDGPTGIADCFTFDYPIEWRPAPSPSTYCIDEQGVFTFFDGYGSLFALQEFTATVDPAALEAP